MNKKLFFFSVFSLLLSCLFAEQILLERRVDNKVQRYWKCADQKVFEEYETVKIYCKEFASADGKEKFGWAYYIDSGLINNSTTKQSDKKRILFDDDECLLYYIKNGRFYVKAPNGLWYDFAAGDNNKDGYSLYFMFVYAYAVNDLLTYGNDIDFHTDAKHDYYWTDSLSVYDDSFSVKKFPEYVENSKEPLKIKIYLIKDCRTKSSSVAGQKISDILKKGLYKSRWRQNNNRGYLGRMSINEGLITCWFNELDEMQHDLLIDYKTVSVKRN